jgi:hypothetical protein
MVSLTEYVFLHKTTKHNLIRVGVRCKLTYVVYMYQRELSHVRYAERKLTHVEGILISSV